MRAPGEILPVWHKFDDFPMETLTKAWYYSQATRPRQRPVPLMEEHRARLGTSGNCFDLAIWLLHEFGKAGVHAYAIGHGLGTPDAHVAVVAVSGFGHRYLCDLGDQWIQPVLIDPAHGDFSSEELGGFFPGARIRVHSRPGQCEVTYLRPGGKTSRQVYDLAPVEKSFLMGAAEYSQNLLRHAVCEMRIRMGNEVVHWEFDRWRSWFSTNSGLTEEPGCRDLDEWCDRIHARSGVSRDVVRAALDVYRERGGVVTWAL